MMMSKMEKMKKKMRKRKKSQKFMLNSLQDKFSMLNWPN